MTAYRLQHFLVCDAHVLKHISNTVKERANKALRSLHDSLSVRSPVRSWVPSEIVFREIIRGEVSKPGYHWPVRAGGGRPMLYSVCD